MKLKDWLRLCLIVALGVGLGGVTAVLLGADFGKDVVGPHTYLKPALFQQHIRTKTLAQWAADRHGFGFSNPIL